MARGIRVKAAAVVLRTRDKREAYHYRGAVVPADAFTPEAIAHAKSLGLIEVIDVDVVSTDDDSTSGSGDQAASTPSGSDAPVEVPEGEPKKGWTHAQIDAWAGRQTPPIVFEGDLSIDKKLAAIEAAQKS